MSPWPPVPAAALATTLLGLLACGGSATPGDAGDPGPADAAWVAPPALRNPVDLPDDELALAALQRLGADVPDADDRCGGCHGLTKQQLRNWRTLTAGATAACLTDESLPSAEVARTTADCFRNSADGPFDADRMGIWAAAARLPWFEELFRRAYGPDAVAEHGDLVDRAAMPPAGTDPLTQAEFDVVAEWFDRGLPRLDETLVTDPPPEACLPSVGAEVAAHVAAMATTGWRQVNQDNALAMFGCAGAATTLDCLGDEPLSTTQAYAAGWPVGAGTMRLLADFDYQTAYWSRASTDGRFFAAGGGVAANNSSVVIDLASADHQITISGALYDPAFFPDNEGFVFQGAGRNVCRQSILLGTPATISLSGNSSCAGLNAVGLYEHVGRAPGGGDYFAISGNFVSDDGGHSATLDNPAAAFDANEGVRLTPMIFGGVTFAQRASTVVDLEFEGDAVLSPSSRLVATRLAGPGDRHLGFVLRAVEATPPATPDAPYDITLPEIGRYCVAGGKPAFSFDERWMIYHHYVEDTDADALELGFTGRADPGFDAYQTLGAANVHVIDLLTGEDTRITNMAAGQYALFPHFRSDGWVYFHVRDTTTGDEHAVAADAVLRLEAE